MSRACRLAAVLAVTGWAAVASAQVCVGGLDKTEYAAGGFVPSDLGLSFNVQWANTPQPAGIGLSVGAAFGWVESRLISTEVNAGDPDEWSIGHVLITATATFPPPCPVPSPSDSTLGGSGATRVDVFFSTSGHSSWELVSFPVSSLVTVGNQVTGQALIDTVGLGLAGTDLYWLAQFHSGGVPSCAPVLSNLAVGYEGVPAGTYQGTEPIPVGNVILRSTYQTAGDSFNDRHARGHLTAKLLYDTDAHLDYTDPLGPPPPSAWAIGDAGAGITFGFAPPGSGPDLRTVLTEVAGIPAAFSASVALFAAVLAPAARPLGWFGQRVYDFNGDALVDDSDAGWLINWVRGWADGTSKTTTKEWGLGAIRASTPAVVGPPGDPWWLTGAGTPATERTLFGTPCTPTPGTFVTTNANRSALAIVGSQDGFFHAFSLGAFRWCNDPSTGIDETNGWFAASGARNYGTGREVWAWAPPGLLDAYRSQPDRAQPFAAAGGPDRASTDAAVTIADVCVPPAGLTVCAGFKTVMVAPETRAHPHVTALDVTNTAAAPLPLWNQDWPPAAEMDSTFQGTEFSPSVGPVLAHTGAGPARRWEAAVTSGISSIPTDLYLYLIDLQYGNTLSNFGARDGFGRVKLNVAGGNADCSGLVLGSYGSPVMVDSDVDGVVDRIYVADTKGCLYKVETASMTVCPLAALGETVFAPIAVRVPDDVSGRVEVFVAGGDDPEALDLAALAPAVPHFHLFGIEDDDAPGACGPPRSLFTADLTPSAASPGVVHKVWSAPAVSNDAVYVATTVGDLKDPCYSDPANPGLLLGFSLTSTITGVPRSLLSMSLGGNGAGGVHVYDGHLFANTASGGTVVLGRTQSWGLSSPFANPRSRSLFSLPLWNEH